MKAQILSVMQPLTGPLTNYRLELVGRLQKIQSWWRSRVKQLKVAGLTGIQSERIVYVCNCPPFACGYEPKMQQCNLRICPFCHARRVAKIYERIRNLMINTPGGAQIAAWRRCYGLHGDSARIYFDGDMGLENTFCKDVHPRHRTFRHEFRKNYMADAIGGSYWYTIAPYTYPELAADGSAGRWNVLHGCVAVMPHYWKPWKSENLRVIRNPDDYQLAWLVGRTFQYRKLWLSSDVTILTALLNATHRDVFLSAFGKLGPNSGK